MPFLQFQLDICKKSIIINDAFLYMKSSTFSLYKLKPDSFELLRLVLFLFG